MADASESRPPDEQRSLAGDPKPAERQGPFLVVGLGNPGLDYLWTPHNAGFMAIDRIAQQEGVVVQNRRCRAVTATCRIAGRAVVLAKPETFMNLSGLAVAALVGEFEADPARDLLVIYDELDLKLGTFKIRERGSTGRPQRGPQRNRRLGRPGVAAAAHRGWTRFAAGGFWRPEAGEGLPAVADAQGGSDGARRGA